MACRQVAQPLFHIAAAPRSEGLMLFAFGGGAEANPCRTQVSAWPYMVRLAVFQ